MRTRVIPTLLLHDNGLVKSVKFGNYKYVGDPINAVKIFNEKEVDEIVILDIDATRNKRPPDIKRIAEIASEAFMPLAYGGGITTLEQVKEILFNGMEKVVINKAASLHPALITSIANQFGSQSVMISIDYKKTVFGGKKVFTDNGKTNTGKTVLEYAKQMENAGAGELLINSIEKDGTYNGYDLEMIEQ
jgi:cyclase